MNVLQNFSLRFKSKINSKAAVSVLMFLFALVGTWPFSYNGHTFQINKFKFIYLCFVTIFSFSSSIIYIRLTMKLEITQYLWRIAPPVVMLLSSFMFTILLLKVKYRQKLLNCCLKEGYEIYVDVFIIPSLNSILAIISFLSSIFLGPNTAIKLILAMAVFIHDFQSFSCSAELIICTRATIASLPDTNTEWKLFCPLYDRAYNLYKRLLKTNQELLLISLLHRTLRLILLAYMFVVNPKSSLPFIAHIFRSFGYLIDNIWFYSNTGSFTQQVCY